MSRIKPPQPSAAVPGLWLHAAHCGKNDGKPDDLSFLQAEGWAGD
jgi:hypothetical protein